MPNVRAAQAVFVAAPVAVPTAIAALPNSTKPTVPVVRKRTDRVNVLLLGGDAGPNRWGLRTDAMHLVSIDLNRRDIAVISIPRNLSRAPMPAGLRGEFPNGFTSIANAVYGWGAANSKKVINALGPTDNPGASLTAAMVAELTNQRVDAWVLMDMQGFLDIIDAFGGVNVWVSKFVKTPGNVAGGKHPLRDFTVGWHHMDGTDALGYTRSRTSDSDYYRMARQRCVLASLAAQTNATTLAWRWGAIATVMERSVRTNLTPELLMELKAAVGTDPDNARVLSLNPPLVPSSGWDINTVHNVVANVIKPPLVRDIAPPAAKGEASTTTTLPVPKGSAALDGEVADECRTRP
jgi:LCP family protein required for cell wall assembly